MIARRVNPLMATNRGSDDDYPALIARGASNGNVYSRVCCAYYIKLLCSSYYIVVLSETDVSDLAHVGESVTASY